MENIDFKKIRKTTLRKSWWRWFTGNLSSMSFEWLASFAFADSMAPVIEELYPDDKEKQIEALKRHSVFYNTEPQIGAVINGIACGLEEEKANGADLDDEVINGIKIGLMGPIAGIGDAMLPGMLIPLLLSIAIGLSTGGSPVGAIFYIIVYMSLATGLSYYLFMKGYNVGTKSIELIVGEAAQRVRSAFNLLGTIIVGGVAASYVNVNLAWMIPGIGGADPIAISAVLDGIFPKVVSLLIVLFAWFLMAKKKVSPLKTMLVLVLLAVVGVFIGAF